jgi:dihydroorotate dehydrogenase electron transfer subunit
VETHTDGDTGVAMVTDHLRGLAEQIDFDAFYVCGSNRLARATHALAGRLGIMSEIAMEQHMACGFGDCHGCVIDVYLDPAGKERGYREVCHYGPVFNTWEVVHAGA